NGSLDLVVPRHDVGVLAVAPWGVVGPLAPDVEVAVIAGAAFVEVRIAPGIAGDAVLLEVGAVPVWDVRIRDQGVQTQGRGRVGADVQTVLVQGGAEELDLSPRRGLLGLTHAAEEPRAHQPREQPQHDDHDEQLDEGEAALAPVGAPSASLVSGGALHVSHVSYYP